MRGIFNPSYSIGALATGSQLKNFTKDVTTKDPQLLSLRTIVIVDLVATLAWTGIPLATTRQTIRPSSSVWTSTSTTPSRRTTQQPSSVVTPMARPSVAATTSPPSRSHSTRNTIAGPILSKISTIYLRTKTASMRWPCPSRSSKPLRSRFIR